MRRNSRTTIWLSGAVTTFRKLCVSANKRFLTYENGEQFFYLGDTGWEIFHVASKGDVDWYLSDRAAKGFTLIQDVISSRGSDAA
jgi:hypothetical protein